MFGNWGKYIKDCNVENKYVLTPYLINDGKIHPAAIICPGGGYKMVCNFMEGEPIAKYLNSKGLNAFVLRYAFGQKAKYPHPQDDLATAVKELMTHQEEYHIDMNKYSIWGFSAGGHLAGSFGYEYARYNLPKPYTLVLVYPVITLGKYTHKNTKKYLLGSHPKEEDIFDKSIHTHVTIDYPRTFLWCGDIDKSVPPVNCDLLVKQLQKCDVEYEFIKYHNVGHGVGLAQGTNADGWADSAINFWLYRE